VEPINLIAIMCNLYNIRAIAALSVIFGQLTCAFVDAQSRLYSLHSGDKLRS
jgi:hypothetical protein